jgi:MoxR-like ATPase
LEPVIDVDQVLALQEAVRQVAVEASIQDYMLDIVQATRQSAELTVGSSTRGALSLYRACQSLALVEGRDYVVPDDVKRLAVPVLAHRVIGRVHAHGHQRRQTESIVQRLVEETQSP